MTFGLIKWFNRYNKWFDRYNREADKNIEGDDCMYFGALGCYEAPNFRGFDAECGSFILL